MLVRSRWLPKGVQLYESGANMRFGDERPEWIIAKVPLKDGERGVGMCMISEPGTERDRVAGRQYPTGPFRVESEVQSGRFIELTARYESVYGGG